MNKVKFIVYVVSIYKVEGYLDSEVNGAHLLN